MKGIIRRGIVAIVCIIMSATVAMADNDRPTTVDKLPKAAQQTLATHFAGKKVAMAKVDGRMSKDYDVVFTTGEKVEFDSKGNWTDIDCKRSAVPAKLVPKQISKYVSANYHSSRIVKIDRSLRKGTYEVELSNGIEIKFNKAFAVIDID